MPLCEKSKSDRKCYLSIVNSVNKESPQVAGFKLFYSVSGADRIIANPKPIL